MNLSFQVAGEAQREELRVFSEKLFRETYSDLNTAENMTLYCQQNFSKEAFVVDFRRPTVNYVMALDEGVMAGYAKLVRAAPVPGEIAGEATEIARFYVERAYRGKGLAPWFMDQCLQWIRAQGGRQVWLGVWPQNPRAVQFYTKKGFTKIGTAPFLLGTDPQTDDILWKAL
jgi:diamine N-acetyltransferase